MSNDGRICTHLYYIRFNLCNKLTRPYVSKSIFAAKKIELLNSYVLGRTSAHIRPQMSEQSTYTYIVIC